MDGMRGRKRIYLDLVLVIALVYIVLLTILYCSESADSDAVIRSLGAAF